MHIRNWGSAAASLLVVTFAFAPCAHTQPVDRVVAGPATVQRVNNPVADPKAIVVFGHARFTVLTPQLIRIEWSATNEFEDHASLAFVNRHLLVPKFEHSVMEMNGAQCLTIRTSALDLTYNLTPNADKGFTPGNLSIALTVENKKVVWHPGLPNPENLLGTTRTLDDALGNKIFDPKNPAVLKPLPIGQGLISRAGWDLVDDSARPLFDSADFRFIQGEKSPWPWAMARPGYERSGSYTDWYFFGYGHDYRQALGDFVRVAGRIPVPPRFAFGIWWSRYWAYSDQELDQLVRGFKENHTPLNVLVIDMDWHINNAQLQARGDVDQSGETLGWTGYTWNKLLFPDPTAFLKHMHEEGLKVTLNLHPASGIQPWEAPYPAMARAMGIDPATKKYIPFDAINKKWATNYFDLVLHPLEKQGIDFWWLDWQQNLDSKIPGVNNTWWLNYLHFTDQQREGKRPLLFHRWGGLGNHRYQIGFSGDVFSVWPSLAYQPWFTATAANVGYAYWSHDIGGHVPGTVDPELFTRWVQFGAFSPILRTHTTKNPQSERRIWAYPEPYSSVLRDTYQLRMAMQPYIYTEARRTYDTGVAFLHPLYYDWPNEEAAYTSKNEYMFGSQMLVAPITSQADSKTGLANEKIWLPAGEWIERPTGKHFTGPITIDRSFSIDQIPVYLRAGAIVPMQPAMLYTGQKPVDPLIINIWPLTPGESSHYSLYEDSGVSVLYQRGVFTRTPIHATEAGDTLRVEISPVEGSFSGMLKSRAYELRLPADWPPDSITVNGKRILKSRAGHSGWSFVGNTLTTVIPTASFSTASRVVIEIHRAPGSVARRSELDGFAGSMTRLRSAFDALQQTWPASAPPDTLIDVMQTGDRLGYHPERAADEIAHFHNEIPKAKTAVAAITQPGFEQRIDNHIQAGKRRADRWVSLADIHFSEPGEKQRALDSLSQAKVMVQQAGK
ncbi:MAG: TIM-barrel domain-containing protein [Acidobacteriaceae bacterium]